MRNWVRETIEGNNKGGYVVRCSAPGCTNTMSVCGLGSRNAHQSVPKFFRTRGWRIARKEGQDVCPAHRHYRHSNPRGDEPMPTVEPAPTSKPETHIHVPIPPDPMSKQDRRVIWAKLEEVYVSEDVGYADGWDDDTLAKDLGVPVAWVAEVRDPNFGPNVSRQSARLLEEGTALLDEMKHAVALYDARISEVKAISAEIAKLTLRVEKFEKQLADIRKKSGK